VIDMTTPRVTLYASPRPRDGATLAYDAIECEHARALLLVSNVDHVVETCASANASPSGAVPCVEIDGDVDGDAAFDGRAPRSAREAGYRARAATAARARDADGDAGADERAVIAGVNAMVRENLRVASDYFTFVDERGYGAYRSELSKTLPFPLSAWTARLKASEAKKELERAGVDGERACAACVEAYSAMNNMLVNASTRYGDDSYWMCGNKPRSCDAAAYAQLSYHARSPSCEALRTEMKRFPRLVRYINDVTERLNAMQKNLVKNSDDVRAAETVDSSAWGDRYDSNHAKQRSGWKPRTTKKTMSQKDKDMRRKAWYSVGFAAVSVIAYMFIGGVISLDFGDDDEREQDDEEEDDDDDDANETFVSDDDDLDDDE